MKRWPVIVAVIAAVVFVLAACGPHPPGATDKERFDNWLASSGVKIVHARVPCERDNYLQCDSTGGYEIDTKTIFLDDAKIAAVQAKQPGEDTYLHVFYHEASHAAFFVINAHLNPFPGDPGTAVIWWEREAQCGMRALVGAWAPPGSNPDIYWICPDAKVAETRWIWASHGVI